MIINCSVIDAGARYGLHPSWNDLRGLVDFHLFELDPQEADRLQRKYGRDARIKVYPMALNNRDGAVTYRVSTHNALNSMFRSNDELLRRNDYMLRDFAATEERQAPARSIDSLFAGQDVHFMKLDTEGAEFDILTGAKTTLARATLGVRSEVLFAPIYQGAAQFGDLNRLLQEVGFELLNLDYAGAGNKAGRFTLPGRYGKLLSTDAVWTVGEDRLFAAKGEKLRHDVVRFALFLMLNGATDLAIDTLLRAVKRENVSFAADAEDPLFQALHKKALLLFKSLLTLPQLPQGEVTDAYKTIFGRPFPEMNKFYESDIFN